MVNRSFADMRRTPVSPASCRAFFSSGFAKVMADSHTRWIIKDYLFFPSAMSWLITFLAIWPIALSVLLRFAARIDPRSGRWRHW
jgi:hypothetical protein